MAATSAASPMNYHPWCIAGFGIPSLCAQGGADVSGSAAVQWLEELRRALNRESVLIVDDEPVVANLVGRQIAADGYKVDIANDGVEAVLKFVTGDYSFVVLDIAMPRLNGTDTLRIMKAVKPEVPVVTVTGHVGRGEMAETVKLGAVACLAKPYTIEQLRQAVAIGVTRD